jgi:RNA binding exosome subunit
MKVLHRVKIRGIVPPGDEEDFVDRVEGLVDEEDFSLDWERDEAEDFSGEELVFLRTSIEKTRRTNDVADAFRSGLSEGDRELLVSQRNRLDDNLEFYVRLDLDAFLDGLFVLTESGDCVHFTLKIAAYPAKKDAAYSKVATWLDVNV